jgi:hypothetical protein
MYVYGAHVAETLVNHIVWLVRGVSTAHFSGWVGTRGGLVGGVVVKTSCWVLKEQPDPRWGIPCVGCPGGGGCCFWPVPSSTKLCSGVSTSGCGWWVWVVGGVLFENCTVDASIFVVKFVRANGGCLGTRSR